MKYQDSELRYLYAGDEQVIRRIYFAVRDAAWDTIPADLEDVSVTVQSGGFTIDLQARCRSETVDYSWRGRLTGTPEGTITYKVEGKPNRSMRGVHAGFCVLYDVALLAGRRFQWRERPGGPVTEGRFPDLIEDDVVFARDLKALWYTTPEGIEVTTVNAGAGEAQPGMEDQRAWGDSSYKFFQWETVDDPNGTQWYEISIGIRNAIAGTRTEGPVCLRLGDILPNTAVPRVLEPNASEPGQSFRIYNGSRSQYADAIAIAHRYTPPYNLADDDTLMENVPTVWYQATALHSFAPQARIRIDPVSFESPYPRKQVDRRRGSPFAAAWATRVLKYVSLGKVDEVVFAEGYEPIADVAPYAGRPLRAVNVDAPGFDPIDALAIAVDGTTVVWLINMTGEPQRAEFAQGPSVELSPYGVHQITILPR